MDAYDPDEPVDPKEWLAMDEDERLDLIKEYHENAGIELPNLQLHAVLQCTIENQVALGDETRAKATLERLMREDLPRHDAIHAIANVFTIQIWEHQTEGTEWDQARYDRELDALTAESWLRSSAGEDEE